MLQVVPLNEPKPDSNRAAPTLPASVMRGHWSAWAAPISAAK